MKALKELLIKLQHYFSLGLEKAKSLIKRISTVTLPRVKSKIKDLNVLEFISNHRIKCMGLLTVFMAIIATVLAIQPVIASASQNSDAAALGAHLSIDEQSFADVVEITPTPTPSPTPTPTPTPDPTLRFGDENERVQELQERLMALNYMDLDESTQYYGPATEYAVVLFQRQHDIDMDGVAGPVTLDILFSDEAKFYTLLEGTRGNDVDSLQRQLVDLGYLSHSTGYYGSLTVAAVTAFQERNGLVVDGKTGAQTLALIYSPNAIPSESQVRAERRNANIQNFISTLEAQLGKPYVFGAVGPDSFDCSGLVYYALRQAGSTRSRYNAAGYAEVSEWEKITSMDNLQVGDLLFFSSGGLYIGHVGVYIGNGTMIDASASNGRVVQRSCTTSFWTTNFIHARRPF